MKVGQKVLQTTPKIKNKENEESGRSRANSAPAALENMFSPVDSEKDNLVPKQRRHSIATDKDYRNNSLRAKLLNQKAEPNPSNGGEVEKERGNPVIDSNPPPPPTTTTTTTTITTLAESESGGPLADLPKEVAVEVNPPPPPPTTTPAGPKVTGSDPDKAGPQTEVQKKVKPNSAPPNPPPVQAYLAGLSSENKEVRENLIKSVPNDQKDAVVTLLKENDKAGFSNEVLNFLNTCIQNDKNSTEGKTNCLNNFFAECVNEQNSLKSLSSIANKLSEEWAKTPASMKKDLSENKTIQSENLLKAFRNGATKRSEKIEELKTQIEKLSSEKSQISEQIKNLDVGKKTWTEPIKNGARIFFKGFLHPVTIAVAGVAVIGMGIAAAAGAAFILANPIVIIVATVVVVGMIIMKALQIMMNDGASSNPENMKANELDALNKKEGDINKKLSEADKKLKGLEQSMPPTVKDPPSMPPTVKDPAASLNNILTTEKPKLTPELKDELLKKVKARESKIGIKNSLEEFANQLSIKDKDFTTLSKKFNIPNRIKTPISIDDLKKMSIEADKLLNGMSTDFQLVPNLMEEINKLESEKEKKSFNTKLQTCNTNYKKLLADVNGINKNIKNQLSSAENGIVASKVVDPPTKPPVVSEAGKDGGAVVVDSKDDALNLVGVSDAKKDLLGEAESERTVKALIDDPIGQVIEKAQVYPLNNNAEAESAIATTTVPPAGKLQAAKFKEEVGLNPHSDKLRALNKTSKGSEYDPLLNQVNEINKTLKLITKQVGRIKDRKDGNGLPLNKTNIENQRTLLNQTKEKIKNLDKGHSHLISHDTVNSLEGRITALEAKLQKKKEAASNKNSKSSSNSTSKSSSNSTSNAANTRQATNRSNQTPISTASLTKPQVEIVNDGKDAVDDSGAASLLEAAGTAIGTVSDPIVKDKTPSTVEVAPDVIAKATAKIIKNESGTLQNKDEVFPKKTDLKRPPFSELEKIEEETPEQADSFSNEVNNSSISESETGSALTNKATVTNDAIVLSDSSNNLKVQGTSDQVPLNIVSDGKDGVEAIFDSKVDELNRGEVSDGEKNLPGEAEGTVATLIDDIIDQVINKVEVAKLENPQRKNVEVPAAPTLEPKSTIMAVPSDASTQLANAHALGREKIEADYEDDFEVDFDNSSPSDKNISGITTQQDTTVNDDEDQYEDDFHPETDGFSQFIRKEDSNARSSVINNTNAEQNTKDISKIQIKSRDLNKFGEVIDESEADEKIAKARAELENNPKYKSLFFKQDNINKKLNTLNKQLRKIENDNGKLNINTITGCKEILTQTLRDINEFNKELSGLSNAEKEEVNNYLASEGKSFKPNETIQTLLQRFKVLQDKFKGNANDKELKAKADVVARQQFKESKAMKAAKEEESNKAQELIKANEKERRRNEGIEKKRVNEEKSKALASKATATATETATMPDATNNGTEPAVEETSVVDSKKNNSDDINNVEIPEPVEAAAIVVTPTLNAETEVDTKEITSKAQTELYPPAVVDNGVAALLNNAPQIIETEPLPGLTTTKEVDPDVIAQAPVNKTLIESAAARKIQSVFRGHVEKKELKKLKQEAKVQLEKKNDAATLIQSRFRGHNVRSAAKKANEANAANAAKKQNEAANTIQKFVKKYQSIKLAADIGKRLEISTSGVGAVISDPKAAPIAQDTGIGSRQSPVNGQMTKKMTAEEKFTELKSKKNDSGEYVLNSSLDKSVLGLQLSQLKNQRVQKQVVETGIEPGNHLRLKLINDKNSNIHILEAVGIDNDMRNDLSDDGRKLLVGEILGAYLNNAGASASESTNKLETKDAIVSGESASPSLSNSLKEESQVGAENEDRKTKPRASFAAEKESNKKPASNPEIQFKHPIADDKSEYITLENAPEEVSLGGILTGVKDMAVEGVAGVANGVVGALGSAANTASTLTSAVSEGISSWWNGSKTKPEEITKTIFAEVKANKVENMGEPEQSPIVGNSIPKETTSLKQARQKPDIEQAKDDIHPNKMTKPSTVLKEPLDAIPEENEDEGVANVTSEKKEIVEKQEIITASDIDAIELEKTRLEKISNFQTTMETLKLKLVSLETQNTNLETLTLDELKKNEEAITRLVEDINEELETQEKPNQIKLGQEFRKPLSTLYQAVTEKIIAKKEELDTKTKNQEAEITAETAEADIEELNQGKVSDSSTNNVGVTKPIDAGGLEAGSDELNGNPPLNTDSTHLAEIEQNTVPAAPPLNNTVKEEEMESLGTVNSTSNKVKVEVEGVSGAAPLPTADPLTNNEKEDNLSGDLARTPATSNLPIFGVEDGKGKDFLKVLKYADEKSKKSPLNQSKTPEINIDNVTLKPIEKTSVEKETDEYKKAIGLRKSIDETNKLKSAIKNARNALFEKDNEFFGNEEVAKFFDRTDVEFEFAGNTYTPKKFFNEIFHHNYDAATSFNSRHFKPKREYTFTEVFNYAKSDGDHTKGGLGMSAEILKIFYKNSKDKVSTPVEQKKNTKVPKHTLTGEVEMKAVTRKSIESPTPQKLTDTQVRELKQKLMNEYLKKSGDVGKRMLGMISDDGKPITKIGGPDSLNTWDKAEKLNNKRTENPKWVPKSDSSLDTKRENLLLAAYDDVEANIKEAIKEAIQKASSKKTP